MKASGCKKDGTYNVQGVPTK